MAKPFLDKDFLLDTPTAQTLYHRHAASMPIIDYHCHLSPQEVACDHHFRSITELWLGGDHYKWRAMRANGIDERYVTGDASDWEKFEKWAETMPYLFRNPLYHWTHMELRTAFGIDQLLNPLTARAIYEACNEQIAQETFSARGLMRRYGVEVVCTTDDPVDTLEWHRQTAESGFEIRMLPTWRPDKALAIDQPVAFRRYMEQLSAAADIDITDYHALIEALHVRHDFFAAHGCRLSDHGLDRFYATDYKGIEISDIFDRVMTGLIPDTSEVAKFRSALLYELAVMDAEAGWTQQFHYGPLRNTNTRLFSQVGPDAGCDTIGQGHTAREMARFFDRLEQEDHLAQTIVYNLNPADNSMVAAMMGCFQDGKVPGKMQWGAGWWFLDQKDGIEKHLNTLSVQGLLSRFVGMLTDSRSFLSYPRHDYFRRILCNLLGNDVEQGLLPEAELGRIGMMVEDICYRNARRYFRFQ